MTPAPITTAYAIKAPEGKLFGYAIAKTRLRAIQLFCEYGDTWRNWYRKGWRCVRVQVQEVEG